MRRLIVWFAALLILGACAGKPDPDVETLADEVRTHLANGDLASLRAISIIPELHGENSERTFQQLSALIPPGEPATIRSTMWSSSSNPDGNSKSLIREYTYPDRTLTLSVVAKTYEDGNARLSGFQVHFLNSADIPDPNFTLENKPAAQLAMLALFAVNAAFMLATCAVGLFRRRWGWAILSLAGVTSITLNWTTGQLFYNLVMVRLELFGGSLTRGVGSLDPWLISSTLPVGAALFWLNGKWRRKEPPPPLDKRWPHGSQPEIQSSELAP